MSKSKAVVFAVIIAAAISVMAVPCHGAGNMNKSPDELRTDATNDVNVAMRLVKQAQDMLASKVTKENMQAASGLYVQAGQLFEKSEIAFNALGEKYGTKQDAEQCERLKNECIQALTSLKKAMQQ